jgi:peptidyl-prolyl cis-trans isomerase SurA
MAFRNRPVLDRKHRPRWQDELRTQQLLVVGFAVAIAVAVGIFGANAWSDFYQTNLKQAALVGTQPVEREAIYDRINIMAGELQASAADLATQTDGMRGDFVQQQLQSLQGAIQQVTDSGADSVVTGITLARKAAELGITVSQDAVDKEYATRTTIPERRELSIIVAAPKKDKNATKLTDANWAAAKVRIDELKKQLDAGGDFATLARDKSDDTSKSKDGLLGWIEADDAQYGEYFTAAKDAQVGDIIGPTRNDSGWYLLKVEDITTAHENTTLKNILANANISDDAYRAYVREKVLQNEFESYFDSKVVTLFEPQRKVAQIKVDLDTSAAGPKVHIRHLLVAPLPGQQDQSKATAAQWQAALDKARALRREAVKPNADWYKLALQSDDPGTKDRGGSLGWADLGTLNTQFVPEFASAVLKLDTGGISQPVKSQFGYHIIQVTDRRTSAQTFATDEAAKLQTDPGSFADEARRISDDRATAKDGGELGWVLHYQLDNQLDTAIFNLDKPGQVTDDIATTSGIYIFKLEAIAEHRYATKSQRDRVKAAGFVRWVQQLKDEVGVWLDAEFLPSNPTTTV